MKTIQQDITTIERGVLINGVNCQDVMGSGVARAYFSKWFEVKGLYHDRIAGWRMIGDNESSQYLGRMDPVQVGDELYVANCFTQEFFGGDGKKYADEGAIMASITQAALFARRLGLEVYTPWVGCGLGGLSESAIGPLLGVIETVTQVPITVCEI